MIRKQQLLAIAFGGLLVASSALAETTSGYDKGFFIKSDQWDIRIGTRTQLQYSSTSPDTSITDSLLGKKEDTSNLNELTVRRFKLYMNGTAHKLSLKWKIQLDVERFRAGGGSSGNVRLEEAFLDWTAKPWTQVRLGQFKVPFGYEKMTSSGKLNLVDRSIVHSFFGVDQETGVNLYGQSFDRKFKYDLAVTTGVSDNKGFDTRNEVAANGDSDFRYMGRVTWEPLTPYAFEQGAVTAPDAPQLTLQLGLQSNRQAVPLDGDPFLPAGRVLPFNRGVLGANSSTFDSATDTFLTQWSTVTNSRKSYDRNEVELVAAYKFGNFAIEGQAISSDVEPELRYLRAKNAALRDIDISAFGSRLQAGYFVIPTRFELAGRWAEVSRESVGQFTGRSDIKQEINQTELRAGLNWYFSKHDWKWQFDVGQIETEWLLNGRRIKVPTRGEFAGGVGFDDRVIQDNVRKDFEIRTQFQVQF